MKRLLTLMTLAAAALLTGCATPVAKTDLSAFEAAKPRSILVLSLIHI